MEILVTGGSGFLGSHVADALSDKGATVTILDCNPSPFLRSDQKMICGDILDFDFVNSVVAGKKYVFHYAGLADIDICKIRPRDAITINIIGTTNLLEASVQHGISQFIFASSAYVFSKHGFFYKTSKQTCESLLHDYYDVFSLPYTCIRYGSLYGPRSDMHNSIHRIIRQALSEKKITYFGTGDELREYIHVADAAKLTAEVINTEKFLNESIIITGNEKFFYRDILELVKEIVGGDIEIILKKKRDSAHYKLTPYNYSPHLGKKVTNTEFVDFGQGILQCIEAVATEIYQQQTGVVGTTVK